MNITYCYEDLHIYIRGVHYSGRHSNRLLYKYGYNAQFPAKYIGKKIQWASNILKLIYKIVIVHVISNLKIDRH